MRIVAVEGPNGAGKTWFCDALRNKFSDVSFIKTPFYDEALGRAVKEVLKNDKHLTPYKDEIIYGNWLAGCLKLKADQKYVIDRWYDSAMIYSASSVWGSLQDWSFIPLPDLTILLLPPLSVVLRRLRERPALRIYDTQQGYEKVENYYKNLGLDLTGSSKIQRAHDGREFIVLHSEEEVRDFTQKFQL